MDIEIASLVYLIVFRLTIITAGIVSIVLGYRLFCRGVWPPQQKADGTTVEAELGGNRFTVKNAAPGTCMALFGAAMIGGLLFTAPPEVVLKDSQQVEEDESSAGGHATTRESTFRGEQTGQAPSAVAVGEGGSDLEDSFQQGVAFEKQGKIQKAKGKYEEALVLAVEPMNGLAWLEQQDGNLEDALLFARGAVRLKPDEARFLDTLAVTLCKADKLDEAVEIMKKAAALDPQTFGTKSERLKPGHCQ